MSSSHKFWGREKIVIVDIFKYQIKYTYLFTKIECIKWGGVPIFFLRLDEVKCSFRSISAACPICQTALRVTHLLLPASHLHPLVSQAS